MESILDFFIMMIGFIMAMIMVMFWLRSHIIAKKWDAYVFDKASKKHLPVVRLFRSDGNHAHELENAGADGIHHSKLIQGLEFKTDSKGSGIQFKSVKVRESYGGNAKPLTFVSKLGVTQLMQDMDAVSAKQAVQGYLTMKKRFVALSKVEEIKELMITTKGKTESKQTLGDLKNSITTAYNSHALDEVALIEWENNIAVLEEMAAEVSKNGKGTDRVAIDDLLVHKDKYEKKLADIGKQQIFIPEGMTLYTKDVMDGMEGMSAHEYGSSLLAAETKGEVQANMTTQLNKLEKREEMFWKHILIGMIILAIPAALIIIGLMFGPDFIRNARELTETAGQTIANSQLKP